MRTVPSCLFALALAGCGRETTHQEVRLIGAGLDPDEIAAAPSEYGGIVELDWVDFAGGQLPLSLAGLAVHWPVDATISDFKAPYAMIYGFGLIMQDDLPAVDHLYGTFAAPPDQVGVCQTVYEPTAYVSNLVDVGSELTFSNEDGTVAFELGRDPSLYPPVASEVFTYYFGFETYRPATQFAYARADAESVLPSAMAATQLRPANWGWGEELTMAFPGGIPPSDANVASIPVPLASRKGRQEITLPNNPMGVHLSWTGPLYDQDGLVVEDGGEHGRCLRFLDESLLGGPAPASPADCEGVGEFEEMYRALRDADLDTSVPGQVYTGPWETEGGLTFSWAVPEEDEEGNAPAADTVSISVRFLGPLDPTDETLLEGVVPIEATEEVSEEWASYLQDGTVPADAELPQGRRPARACDPDEDVQWMLDDAYFDADGNPVPYLQGDPFRAIAEVTCTVPDEPGEDGFASFTLTAAMLADALDYGRRNGAAGAVFIFSRSTQSEIQAPPVRDAYGNRHDTSPLLVVARAVQLGRFWYNP